MRIALFFVVNIAVALAIAILSMVQDQSVGTIVLRVVGALVVLQVAYVVWLLVTAWMRPRPREEADTKNTSLPEKPLEDA